ncbi:MAG: LPS assembly lipoprotein LptE [Bacteroidetes bacterium]|nr:LPS assembly lipoprotein LptE [Rhodothermia bacterium]MCX7906246.1 LPS assembly lipoprotein LptE [Bacteroidota bacterium]MDW8286427.1 LptE family protein [Bacteroidota bacterium]
MRLLLGGLFTVALGAGCGYYSFTGASIPAHIRSVALLALENQATGALPGLERWLEEELARRLSAQGGLRLAGPEEAQAVLEGRLTGYTNQPVAVAAGERAAVNRVTVSLWVRFYDRVREEVRFEGMLSAYGDYDPGQDPLEGERRAARTAVSRLVEEAFLRIFAAWQ